MEGALVTRIRSRCRPSLAPCWGLSYLPAQATATTTLVTTPICNHGLESLISLRTLSCSVAATEFISPLHDPVLLGPGLGDIRDMTPRPIGSHPLTVKGSCRERGLAIPTVPMEQVSPM